MSIAATSSTLTHTFGDSGMMVEGISTWGSVEGSIWVQFDGGDPASYMIRPDPMVETNQLPEGVIRVCPDVSRRFTSDVFKALQAR